MNSLKEALNREFHTWLNKLVTSIKKDPIRKIALIFLSPFIIHAMAEALLDFGILPTIGYYVSCIYGFSKIVDDPYRIVKWGAGYAIGAAVTPMVFTMVWPEIQKGTSLSIFSGVIIFYVLFMIWWKARELKNS